ncbi:MAG: LysR family transcriptional regulator [Longispora sp.]|nr:LysR family transcriptional regulator [Longispora sp. (in: high G+C Gram-positive bacteria)]
MQLELRHLRVICLIAESGTISRAAAVLGVPQPSVTTQLRRIEESLGAQLFVRSRKGMALTEFGELAITRSKGILSQVDELLSYARTRSVEARPLRFGGTPGLIFRSVLETLGSSPEMPPVMARAELDAVKLVELLSCGELDGATFLEYPGFPPRLPGHMLKAEIAAGPGFVVLPSGHSLADECEIKLSDLCDERWVLPPVNGDGYRGFLRQAFESAGIDLRITYEVADSSSAMDIITRGKALGLGQATRSDQPGLVLKPLVGNPLSYIQILVWDPDGPLMPHVQAIVERARADYRDFALSSPAFQAWLKLNGVPEDSVTDPWGTLHGDTSMS